MLVNISFIIKTLAMKKKIKNAKGLSRLPRWC